MTATDNTRGQTPLDFVIGILVFIAVVAFVFLFVPGILEPFGGDDGEDPAVADRIANSLSQERLDIETRSRPRTIDRQCTVEFFRGEAGDPPDECSIEGGASIDDRLNLESFDRVNVRIRGSTENGESAVRCWDDTDAEWTTVEDDEDDCENFVTLETGNTLPEDRSATITSTRVVSLQGESVTLQVRVW